MAAGAPAISQGCSAGTEGKERRKRTLPLPVESVSLLQRLFVCLFICFLETFFIPYHLLGTVGEGSAIFSGTLPNKTTVLRGRGWICGGDTNILHPMLLFLPFVAFSGGALGSWPI